MHTDYHWPTVTLYFEFYFEAACIWHNFYLENVYFTVVLSSH